MWTILGVIVVLAGIIGVLWTVYRQDELDEREEELDKREIALDERANRIAAEEQTIRGEWESLRKAHDEIIGKKADKTTTPTE